MSWRRRGSNPHSETASLVSSHWTTSPCPRWQVVRSVAVRATARAWNYSDVASWSRGESNSDLCNANAASSRWTTAPATDHAILLRPPAFGPVCERILGRPAIRLRGGGSQASDCGPRGNRTLREWLAKPPCAPARGPGVDILEVDSRTALVCGLRLGGRSRTCLTGFQGRELTASLRPVCFRSRGTVRTYVVRSKG